MTNQPDFRKLLEEAVADILCKELGPQVLHQDVADVDDAVIAEHDAFRQEMLPVAAKIVAAVNALPGHLARIAELEAGLSQVIDLDHHNMGPESRATKLARAALSGGKP
jgi:hypothetical protein